MKKTFTSVFISAIVTTTVAQQDPQFTQNMFNKLLTNPGYAGTNKAICATLLYRNQWTRFDGAPQTGLLSADAYVPKLRGGVGLIVMNDKLGYEKGNYAKLAYSFHLPVGPGVLGIGIEGGMLNKSINGKWITPDGTPAENDPKIPNGNVTTTTYDLGLGVFYSTEKLYAGVSSTHLPEQKLSDLYYQVARTYYFTAGYNYEMSQSLELKPSVFIKSVASPTQMDINCLLQYNKKFYGGLTYRITDAVAALVGFNYQLPNGANLRIGYSYDYTTSALNIASKGSHELMLNYCMIIDPPVKRQFHQNVRFMN